MTQPQFTLDWPYGYQTRDERYVVIYCTDAPGNSPIHGRINGVSAAITWNIHGRFRVDRLPELDLINRPAPVVSVPVDKLMKGYALIDEVGLIHRIQLENPQTEESRNVYFFMAEEMVTTK